MYSCPLHAAAAVGDISTVESLLKKGKKQSLSSVSDNIIISSIFLIFILPVQRYIFDCSFFIFLYSCSHNKGKFGVNDKAAESNSFQTPLHVAAYEGQFDMVRFLLLLLLFCYSSSFFYSIFLILLFLLLPPLLFSSVLIHSSSRLPLSRYLISNSSSTFAISINT